MKKLYSEDFEELEKKVNEGYFLSLPKKMTNDNQEYLHIISELKIRNGILENAKKSLEKENETLKKQTESLTKQIESLSKQQILLKRELTSLADDNRAMSEEIKSLANEREQASAEQKQASAEQKMNSFASCIINMDEADEVVQKIDRLIHGKKGKKAAIVIKAAMKKHLINKPSFDQVTKQFGDVGSKSNFNKQMQVNYTEEELGPYLEQL